MNTALETTSELRDKIAQIAKRHKASWIELGQYLKVVHKDKLYKGWGFLSFEVYCQTELAIKNATAVKLIKSYSFLEKEEPHYVRPDFREEAKPKAVPDFNSVNLLRLAKHNADIAPQDYAQIRKVVLDNCREPKEVRAEINKVITPVEEDDSPEVRRQRRNSAIRRLTRWLERAKEEMAREKLLPAFLFRQMDDLKAKLEDQLEQ